MTVTKKVSPKVTVTIADPLSIANLLTLPVILLSHTNQLTSEFLNIESNYGNSP
jgi:hypothetical protein